MQTITIDILNDKVVRLLKDLELLQLIYVRRNEKSTIAITPNRLTKYTGDFKNIQELIVINPWNAN